MLLVSHELHSSVQHWQEMNMNDCILVNSNIKQLFSYHVFNIELLSSSLIG